MTSLERLHDKLDTLENIVTSTHTDVSTLKSEVMNLRTTSLETLIRLERNTKDIETVRTQWVSWRGVVAWCMTTIISIFAVFKP